MHTQLFVIIVAVWFLVSCSTTPGDAAYRGDHPDAAADLYRQGAEQGDGLAALKLGLMINRNVVPADRYDTAGHWFVRACELGSAAGCHNVGVGYEYGPKENDGLEVNMAKAKDFYQMAAERGYMQSQYNLGSLYANRYFESDVEGLKWLLIAQKSARLCVPDPSCKWVLQDPPGHIAKMRERMPQEAEAVAEREASEWRTPR